VIAFEALPANQEQLRINIKLNGMEERITVVPAAVTHASGEVTFLVHDSPGMGKAAGSAGRMDEYRDEIHVQGISLDEFVFEQGNPPPTVIKMDIEGGEVMALPGMQCLMRNHHPLMLMELHGPDSARVAWDSLNAAGYQVCWMRKGFPVVPSLQEMGWKAYIVARWNG
jgi:FkbM family methyltransferase